MLAIIKRFFVRRKVRHIKGNSLNEQIQTLHLLQKLTVAPELPLHRLREFELTSHHNSLGLLLKGLISLHQTVSDKQTFVFKPEQLIKKQGSIVDWALDIKGVEIPLYKSIPNILGELTLLQTQLAIWATKDESYHEYATRIVNHFLEDTAEYIRILKVVYFPT